MIFKDKVYAITKKIPPGKVATYGQIAKLAGKPEAARVVGKYMKINPNPACRQAGAPIVPCHRVVGFDGELVGYSGQGGVKMKKKMLIQEGVFFINDKVDLKKSQLK